MESTPQPKPILQKPPGYRDPNNQPPPLPKTLPPRKPIIPPSFRPKKRRVFCRICCCTFCILLLIILFLVVIGGGLAYIILEPSLPNFHLGTFRVSKANITDDLDGAYLDADTVTRVEIKNRNGKMVWHFEESSVEIWADNGELNLGSTKVAALAVKERDMAELKVETKVRRVALDARQRRRLKGAFDSKALMPSVEVRTRTGVSVKGWKSMMLGIIVVCGDVTMRQLDNGAMPLCSLTIFKWIKIK